MRTGWGRRAVAVATAALLAAGCSSGYDDDDDLSAEVGGGLTTLDQGGGATTVAGDDAPSTTSAGRPPAGSSGATTPGGGSNRGPSPTTDAEDPIVQASRGAPGGFARTMLRPQPATKLALDVLTEPGAEPRAAAITRVQRMLGEVSGKPVTVSGPSTVEGGYKSSWSAAELRELADRNARTTQGGTQASLRMLFVHGTYQGDGSVLGVAIRGDVLAIFSDSIDRTASPVVREDVIEEAVVMHEVGHLLGLVGLIVRPERQDPEHKGHSRNRESVMYWAVESNLIGQILGGDPPRDFDADDLADLAALRGGA